MRYFLHKYARLPRYSIEKLQLQIAPTLFQESTIPRWSLQIDNGKKVAPSQDL